MPEVAEAIVDEDRSVETDETLEAAPDPVLVDEDLLVEDVSIDGMCGVY